MEFFNENKNKINESWENFFKKLKDKYNIKKIEAIDFALEYNQKEDQYRFSEKSGIRIQIPLKNTDKEGVGAIPFRSALLSNSEYKEFIQSIFKKFLIND